MRIILAVIITAIFAVAATMALYELQEAHQADYTAYLMKDNMELRQQMEAGQAIADGLKLEYLGEFEVTFYNYNSGTTKTGTKPDGLTVAVNPEEIPLGSLIYVEGMGFRIAEDTGGFGARTIDIYLPDYDECIERGRLEGVSVWLVD